MTEEASHSYHAKLHPLQYSNNEVGLTGLDFLTGGAVAAESISGGACSGLL